MTYIIIKDLLPLSSTVLTKMVFTGAQLIYKIGVLLLYINGLSLFDQTEQYINKFNN